MRTAPAGCQGHQVARARSFEPNGCGSNPDLLAVWPWASSRTSLSWYAAICKRESWPPLARVAARFKEDSSWMHGAQRWFGSHRCGLSRGRREPRDFYLLPSKGGWPPVILFPSNQLYCIVLCVNCLCLFQILSLFKIPLTNVIFFHPCIKAW